MQCSISPKPSSKVYSMFANNTIHFKLSQTCGDGEISCFTILFTCNFCWITTETCSNNSKTWNFTISARLWQFKMNGVVCEHAIHLAGWLWTYTTLQKLIWWYCVTLDVIFLTIFAQRCMQIVWELILFRVIWRTFWWKMCSF